MELNEKNLPLAKWLIDKTNTKDYRIGNLSGMKHPKVDGVLLKTVGGRDELVRQAKILERISALGGEEYLHFDWREMNTDITRMDYRIDWNHGSKRTPVTGNFKNMQTTGGCIRKLSVRLL